MKSLPKLVCVLAACAAAGGVAGAAARGRLPLSALAAEMDGGQIVGGRDAQPGEFPHQASMQIVSKGFLWFDADPRHICGGTLIHPGWVLTAAHCVVGASHSGALRVEVLLGAIDIDPDAEPQAGSQRFVVSEMLAHEGYDPNSHNNVGPNDIGLLRLDGTAQLSDVVKLARLPDWDDIPSGEAMLSGWGSTSMDGANLKLPYKLQAVTLPIVPFEKCDSFMAATHPSGKNPLVDTNVCTGPIDKPGFASCRGDSGGPLIQTEAGEAVVVGVASWGLRDCGSRPYPSVYTRTSAFVDWLTDKMSH